MEIYFKVFPQISDILEVAFGPLTKTEFFAQFSNNLFLFLIGKPVIADQGCCEQLLPSDLWMSDVLWAPSSDFFYFTFFITKCFHIHSWSPQHPPQVLLFPPVFTNKCKSQSQINLSSTTWSEMWAPKGGSDFVLPVSLMPLIRLTGICACVSNCHTARWGFLGGVVFVGFFVYFLFWFFEIVTV